MEKNTPDKSLFDILKEIRLKKRLSLEEIAQKSRIQLSYLQSIEKGELQKIPPVYDKLFFKNYLKALGQEEGNYYNLFLEYRKKIRTDKTTTILDFSNSVEKNADSFNFKNLYLLLPVLAAIVIIWLLIVNTEMVTSSTKDNVEEFDIKAMVQEIEKKEAAKNDSIIKELNNASALSLEINGLKQTWFRVITDTIDTTEYLLQSGEKMKLAAHQSFEFLIGKADGLELFLNGIKLDSLGKPGEVISYMRIDSKGINSLIRKLPSTKKELNEKI